MEMKERLFILAWVCITIVAFGMGLLFYWSFIDGKYVNVPLTFNSNQVATEKQTYKKGDPVAIQWDYCKGVDTVSDISITLTDGIIYFLPPIKSNRTVGCYNSFTVITKIPDAIKSGDYKLDGTITFKINPIKNINYKVESNMFWIDENDDMQEQIDLNTERIDYLTNNL